MTEDPTQTGQYRSIQRHIRLANESKTRHNFLDEIDMAERRIGTRRAAPDRRKHETLLQRIRRILLKL